MNTQPEALKIADALDAEIRRTIKLDVMHSNAAAQLRYLYAVKQDYENKIASLEAEIVDLTSRI